MAASLLGATVRTYGLSSAELNGQTGVVVRLQAERAVVSLPSGEKALRPQNLEVLRPQQGGGGGFGNAGAPPPAGGAAGGAGAAAMLLELRRRWSLLGPQLQFACYAALIVFAYWLFFSGPSRSYSHYDDDYHDYDDGYHHGGYRSSGWGFPSLAGGGLGTVAMLGLMYYGRQKGMSFFELMWLWQILGPMLGGGGGMMGRGFGRRRG